MMYVKVKDNVVVQFPYDFTELCKDNPYTAYDNRFDLYGWFVQTEAALNEGYTLHEVKQAPIPENFDSDTQTIRQAEIPVLQDGEWILPLIVEDKLD